MHSPSTLLYPLACGMLGLVLSASSSATGDSSRRQQDAHAHGEGVLEVAVDGHELHIALRIPAANVVGFEHAPANDEQRQRLAAARQQFLDGAGLLVPSAAAHCRLLHAEATIGGDAHDDKPASQGGTHSELAAEYHFRCERPGELVAIDVRLLNILLDVHSLDAHVVSPGYQGARDLSPGQTILKLLR